MEPSPIDNSSDKQQTPDKERSDKGSSSLELAYRQRILLSSITTSAPSVAALRSSHLPQGILLHNKRTQPNKEAPAQRKTAAFVTQSDYRDEASNAFATTRSLGGDVHALSIRSFKQRSPVPSPTKQQELYESRRFRQLYEKDRNLRRLLIKEQLWDRQTTEQTFHATFLDRRPGPAKTL